jgi:hydrogenase maturation protease
MMRILCCGNRDRGDDAAGILVAEHLHQHGINAEVLEGDPLAMIESWEATDDVILVDATVGGAPSGSVRVWEIPADSRFSGGGYSTHGFGVAEAIYLAEIMGRLPRRLRVYGIEGKEFRPGAEVSETVRSACDNVAEKILLELAPAEAKR